MIVSRKEFHRRHGISGFKTELIEMEDMFIPDLMKEIKRDAPFRNHNYMFKKGVDFSELPVQERDGIFKKFPNLKTEAERFKKIKEEIKKGTYDPVPILMDIDHPSVFYVNNGFHRIFAADQLGRGYIKCKITKGKFILSNSISFGDLIKLLEMVSQLSKEKDINKITEEFKNAIKQKPEIADNHSLGYGTDEEYL